MPTDFALAQARDRIDQDYVQVDSSVCKAHTVYEGAKPDGTPCVVVVVPQKKPGEMLTQREAIPRFIETQAGEVPTDVVEAPPFRATLPTLTPFESQYTPFAMAQQGCFSPLKKGGCQIQPQGANWVGTLGGMVIVDGQVCAITNRHVTGMNGKTGTLMWNPATNRGKPFGAVSKVAPIEVSQRASNRIDAALIDCTAEGIHYVTAEQVGLGKLGSKVVAPKVGMEVVKSGRTTGTTKGTIVGINASSVIGYDAGSARFVGQVVIESPSGLFSNSGDSGSFILEAGTNNLVCLLFAGDGRGMTIANVASVVLDYFGAKLYEG